MKRTAFFAATLALAATASAGDFRLVSEDFQDGKEIPAEHTCDGPDRSPELRWEGAPEKAKAYALVVEDPDAPKGTFTHWVLYDIPSGARALGGDFKNDAELGDGSRQATNDFGKVGWAGPCPPKGDAHRYVFKLYALSEPLGVQEGVKSREVVKAIEEKKIAEAKLTGKYKRADAAAE